MHSKRDHIYKTRIQPTYYGGSAVSATTLACAQNWAHRSPGSGGDAFGSGLHSSSEKSKSDSPELLSETRTMTSTSFPRDSRSTARPDTSVSRGSPIAQE